MTEPLLRRLAPASVPVLRRNSVQGATLTRAAQIIADVQKRGERALREYAEEFGELAPEQPLVAERGELDVALRDLPAAQRELLERTATRIQRFAQAQRDCLHELTLTIPGGQAGHTLVPVQTAGCYAPGGRFVLPSSVLMTAIPARVAGVERVWVASPRPTALTLAAAGLAGADGLLRAGGAHAIAGLAYGAGAVPACDTVVGPGNRWVTAAKQLIAGRVGIDMLAGPSELVVVADETASPAVVAADLVAQGEHDPDALPVLVTTHEPLVDAVERELQQQLTNLPTAGSARAALRNGFAVVAADLAEAVTVCDRLAPEHLELHVQRAADLAHRVRHCGSLFIGAHSAEVLGDYGAGPNHVLPTGGAVRSTGGLSVFNFLRVRTWLRVDDPEAAGELVRDATAFARLEQLEGHARSAERRRPMAESDDGA